MRRTEISVGEYYHIFNRGVNKQTIFHDKNDWDRFLFLILYFQSPINFTNISRLTKEFGKNVQHRVLHIEKVIKDRYVELVVFCLMPNHFHLVLKEEKEGGISQYMQRVLNSYAKYYNTKYEKTGHLFQGPYKAVNIEDNNQLLHLSSYIHRNPREFSKWTNKEEKYFYSSYQDYIIDNRWDKLLSTYIIFEQFKNKKEYNEFIKSSKTKLLDGELSLD